MLRVIALFAAMMQTPVEAQIVSTSWYQQGRITANGERFYPDRLTAAHRSLPFGTKLKVKYGKKQIVVRINDRGPFVKGRSLDLSRGAAKALGLQGVQKVEILAMRN